jgi:hypothetical protein
MLADLAKARTLLSPIEQEISDALADGQRTSRAEHDEFHPKWVVS